MAKIYQNNLYALIPAAGKGNRSGLNYPKTLFKINDKPILIHILDLVHQFTSEKTIVINPSYKKIFQKCIKEFNYSVNFVEQKKPLGMGDSILRAEKSIQKASEILLIWGDVPFIKIRTLKN